MLMQFLQELLQEALATTTSTSSKPPRTTTTTSSSSVIVSSSMLLSCSRRKEYCKNISAVHKIAQKSWHIYIFSFRRRIVIACVFLSTLLSRMTCEREDT
mmetsp:Transcript_23298/g.51751  ORF Transcript_23298/g.51751 Transcript_23298/m.51751 type:complete len:100 (-) Transcript_23298:256-555(-)